MRQNCEDCMKELLELYQHLTQPSLERAQFFKSENENTLDQFLLPPSITAPNLNKIDQDLREIFEKK
ncbi:hypothetical protein I7I53_00079 [Histoplasma capsulatum var. duboisii H88]|uniref:Uncharacterized protein n=1 Tax=Ajellomyces capsulatus (strain H88) TaxID=544711 RepID=A0A8A1LJ45_AJEC8|nr:hypothetical protein I7I53_00079 [Histoplasma capsulatum var. duboisii H88]